MDMCVQQGLHKQWYIKLQLNKRQNDKIRTVIDCTGNIGQLRDGIK